MLIFKSKITNFLLKILCYAVIIPALRVRMLYRKFKENELVFYDSKTKDGYAWKVWGNQDMHFPDRKLKHSSVEAVGYLKIYEVQDYEIRGPILDGQGKIDTLPRILVRLLPRNYKREADLWWTHQIYRQEKDISKLTPGERAECEKDNTFRT